MGLRQAWLAYNNPGDQAGFLAYLAEDQPGESVLISRKITYRSLPELLGALEGMAVWTALNTAATAHPDDSVKALVSLVLEMLRDQRDDGGVEMSLPLFAEQIMVLHAASVLTEDQRDTLLAARARPQKRYEYYGVRHVPTLHVLRKLVSQWQ